MTDDTNTRFLYDTLTASGAEGIGDYDTFKSRLSTDEGMRWAYDNAAKNDIETGDYDLFSQSLGKEISTLGTPAPASFAPDTGASGLKPSEFFWASSSHTQALTYRLPTRD